MATTRVRDTWTNILAEVREILGDTDATNPYFSDSLLLQLANECLDQREAELDEEFEGYSLTRATVSLTSGQPYYKLPTPANRVRNVTKLLLTGEEVPLRRTESLTQNVEKSRAVNDNYLPAVRLMKDYVYLAPAPAGNETNSLVIYYEQARNKVTAGSDQLIPDAWPHLSETLIKYDIAVAAFDLEESQDDARMGGAPKGFSRADSSWRPHGGSKSKGASGGSRSTRSPS